MKHSPLLRLGMMFLLIVLLPVFIWAVMTQRIEFRKKADFTGPTLTMVPGSVTGTAGQEFTLAVTMNTYTASVSATELHITYDPQIVHMEEFTPGSMLPVILLPAVIATETGSVSVTLGAQPSSPALGSGILGSIKFSLINNSASTISFANSTIVTATGQSTNALTYSVGTQINIGGSPPPTPTCTPRPKCVEGEPQNDGWLYCAVMGAPPPGTIYCGDPGCHYEKVECVQAPCNPILVCPTTTPTPADWCAGPDGTPCSTTVCAMPGAETNCYNCPQPSPICTTDPSGGTCQNNVCIFNRRASPSVTPTTTPSQGCYELLTYPPQIICPSGTPTPTPTPSPSPTPSSQFTPTPTPTPTLIQATLKFRVKLSGVNDGKATDAGAAMTVKFFLNNGTMIPFGNPLLKLPLVYEGNGIYKAERQVTIPSTANPGVKFAVQVTVDKHLAMRFCQQSGQTEPCDYATWMTPTSLDFDFTGRPMPAGDLNNDGKVGPDDLKIFTDLWHKTPDQLTVDEVKSADVNYNGTLDQLDFFEILKTLSVRYNE